MYPGFLFDNWGQTLNIVELFTVLHRIINNVWYIEAAY